VSFSNVWRARQTPNECEHCGDPPHLAGQCPRCNCGSSEIIHVGSGHLFARHFVPNTKPAYGGVTFSGGRAIGAYKSVE